MQRPRGQNETVSRRKRWSRVFNGAERPNKVRYRKRPLDLVTRMGPLSVVTGREMGSSETAVL